MSAIAPIGSATSTPSLQTLQGPTTQPPTKALHHGGGHKGGGTIASSTSDTSTQLSFNPATGSMEPTGSFSTSA